MRSRHVAPILALTTALFTFACNRPDTAGDVARQEAAAGADPQQQQQRQQQQDEAARLERQLAELEREWQQTQAKVSGRTEAATAELKAEIQEDLTNARDAIGDLRTTTAQNWWERHERVMEQTADEVEQDVRRFARRWTPGEAREVGTAGTTTSWEARRDQLVARMEARIDAMEKALEDVDLRGAQQAEVDDTRARVRKMKEDTDRLRNASATDWWDITKQRVTDYLERVEASIDRVGDGRS